MRWPRCSRRDETPRPTTSRRAWSRTTSRADRSSPRTSCTAVGRRRTGAPRARRHRPCRGALHVAAARMQDVPAAPYGDGLRFAIAAGLRSTAAEPPADPDGLPELCRTAGPARTGPAPSGALHHLVGARGDTSALDTPRASAPAPRRRWDPLRRQRDHQFVDPGQSPPLGGDLPTGPTSVTNRLGAAAARESVVAAGRDVAVVAEVIAELTSSADSSSRLGGWADSPPLAGEPQPAVPGCPASRARDCSSPRPVPPATSAADSSSSTASRSNTPHARTSRQSQVSVSLRELHRPSCSSPDSGPFRPVLPVVWPGRVGGRRASTVCVSSSPSRLTAAVVGG